MENNSSLWSDAYRRLIQNKAAMIGGIVLVVLILCAIFAPLIAPYSYSYQDLNLGASKPSWDHLLGTDVMGRDLLSRILYGARISLMVGFVATSVALVIGVSWGIVAGYFGGRIDSVMMRIVDVLYGLPFIIFIILLMVIFGRNLWLLFGAIGAVEWLTMARIVRGQVIGLKNQEFVLAAQAMGVSNFMMFRKHLFPNILGPIAVYATLTIPQVMLLESFLSFSSLLPHKIKFAPSFEKAIAVAYPIPLVAPVMSIVLFFIFYEFKGLFYHHLLLKLKTNLQFQD